MKHIYYIPMIAAAACCLLSCQKEATESLQEKTHTLTATFESLPDTRTELSASGNIYKVLWSEEDNISVFPDDQTLPCLYTLQSGAGSTEGTFSGYGVGQKYLAYYPGSAYVGRSGADALSVIFPEEQTDIPMAASGSGDKLVFRNLVSILKVPVKGHHIVTKVVFKPNDKSAKVSGPATVSFTNPEAPALRIDAGGTDSLFVDAGSLYLSDDKATDFYLCIPPGEYKGGFTLRIWTTSGYMDKVYSSDFTFERSKVHEAGTVTMKVTNGIEPGTKLDGLGTEAQPYLIKSLPDLLRMQYEVNNNSDPYSGQVNYKLTADIDLSPACGPGRSWIPIGNAKTPLIGNFDGDGHTVSNLYIDSPDGYQQGLLGFVVGAISNLSVSGSINPCCGQSGLVAGYALELTNCTSRGEVYTLGSDTGGLCGLCTSLNACTNYANVYAVFTIRIGGLASSAHTAENCVNYGNVYGAITTGGICAECNGYIANCRNEGSVFGNDSACGGIVGNGAGCTVFNCINNGYVEDSESIGGIAGSSYDGAIVNCVNSGKISVLYKIGGGIVGMLGSSNAYYGAYPSSLLNCVSCGTMTTHSEKYGNYDGKDYGGICGQIIGQKTGQGFSDSEARHVYWLNDPAATFKIPVAIAVNDGIATDVFEKSPEQMKSGVVEELNAWVAEHPTIAVGNESFKLKQWEYDSKTGYPTLKK